MSSFNTIINAAPLEKPHSVHTRRILYSAVESLRIAVQHLEPLWVFLSKNDTDDEPYAIPVDVFYALPVAINVFLSHLEQHVGDVVPSIPDSTLKTLLDWENRCLRNPPHFEGAWLSMDVARRMLDLAIYATDEESDTFSSLDDLMFAVMDFLELYLSVMDGAAREFGSEDVAWALVAGHPLPPNDPRNLLPKPTREQIDAMLGSL